MITPNRRNIKLIDFGSAKFATETSPSIPYVVSRFYRPPELLLGASCYGVSVDIWSLGNESGCIGCSYCGQVAFFMSFW